VSWSFDKMASCKPTIALHKLRLRASLSVPSICRPIPFGYDLADMIPWRTEARRCFDWQLVVAVGQYNS